jgi:hypothetical protein
MFTLITTYYDNPKLLESFVRDNTGVPVIVVDDGSPTIPALSVLKSMEAKNVTLFRVSEDLGFNSHGCRNLAMQQSRTEWNMLVDIDYKIHNMGRVSDDLLDIDPTTPWFFPVIEFNGSAVTRVSINDFVVTRDTYWKAGGYDTEFTGMHQGDRMFIKRMLGDMDPRGVNPLILTGGCMLEEMRSAKMALVRVEEWGDVAKEVVDHVAGTFRYSPGIARLVDTTTREIRDRWLRGVPSDPVPFKWEQQVW